MEVENVAKNMNVTRCPADRPLYLRGQEYSHIVSRWPFISCVACGLPIFSSPSYTCRCCYEFFLHEKCAFLPKELKHFLHYHTLTLVTEPRSNYRSIGCLICRCEPENFIYVCNDKDCFFFLHLLCVYPFEIKILHRSHRHELTPFPGECCFLCDACGEKHEGLSYFCHICGYWLHRDCASLPDIIRYTKHLHTLSLTYGVGFGSIQPSPSKPCAVCAKAIEGTGAYACDDCEYYAHIKCATADPELYNPVRWEVIGPKGRLLRLPKKGKSKSLVDRLMRQTSNKMSTCDIMRVHDHPLVSCDYDDNYGPLHECDACAQPISHPYYRCSNSDCSNFFLHRSCGTLPSVYEHPAHKQHPLSLMKKPPSDRLLSQFICGGCNCECNGFAYGCEPCSFFLDIVCAFLTAGITHKLHGGGHSLSLDITYPNPMNLDCCTDSRSLWFYTCTSCPDFTVHSNCALMPQTIRHEFDRHTLELITDFGENYSSDERFCEICEQKVGVWKGKSKKHWYYGCRECKQWFHVDCIPSVNPALSRIKFGRSVRLPCHVCPVTCIRLPALGGYTCGHCRKIIAVKDGLTDKGLKDWIAFECSKCGYWIHYTCAEMAMGLSHQEEENK